jgi:molecular chaperone HtpG
VRHTFNVDLRGIVDLLSRHLYSSPRVYVRELVQNAVDAITARRALDSGAPGRIHIEPRETTADGSLRIHDTGIGLTGDQVHELLATIGTSSKRDPLGFARHDFLGQFGIGLLACFLVSDEIEVVTRCGDGPTIVWRGHADGHYTLHDGDPRPEQGTTVILRPRRDFEHWLGGSTVTELARHYGSLLPYDLTVGEETINEPWPADRTALLRYGTRILGAAPFDVIDLAVPEAGLTGVAFVLPHPTNPGERAGHRVYLKRMLLGERVEKLMPDWAFFVRCVINTEELHPTASREQVYEDELLAATRAALGARLREWLVRLAATEPGRLAGFLRVHHLGVLALALHDDEILRIVDEWVPFETSDGMVNLGEFRRRHRVVFYTAGADEFRQFASIAAAQGMGLVNGGYTHHAAVVRRLRRLDPDLAVRPLDPDDLATRFEELGAGAEFATREFLAIARRALASTGCEPAIRSFSPASLPVLFLEGTDARFATGLRAAREEADGIWAELLADAGSDDARPVLMFNYRNPLVARLTSTVDTQVVELSTEALYGYAMLAGNRPLRPADVAGVNHAFLGLVEHAIRTG